MRIARLAALDSSRPPEAPVLIVEVDGEIWVAVSLDNLRAVADPFRPSAHVRAIALARAQQMRTVEPRRAQRRLRARHRTSEAAPRPQGAT